MTAEITWRPFLLNPDMRVVNDLLDVVAKYGTPEEINAKAAEARKLPNLLRRLKSQDSPYVKDIEWLTAQRDAGAFVTVADFRRTVLASRRPQCSGRGYLPNASRSASRGGKPASRIFF